MNDDHSPGVGTNATRPSLPCPPPLVESTPREILMRNKEFRAAFEHAETILRESDIRTGKNHECGEITITLGTILPRWIITELVSLYRKNEWFVRTCEENSHRLIFNFYK